MKVMDLHCDALSRWGEDGGLTGEVTAEGMRRGGALGQCFAVFAPWEQVRGRGESPYAVYRQQRKRYEAMLQMHSACLCRARSADEVMENGRKGKISAVLAVEGGDFLEGKLSRLQEAYADGVRMITLTWNTPNELGFPHSPNGAQNALPLRKLGCLAVEAMQELGILVDLSHLNRGGFEEAAKICKKPFVCSHSCCYALCSHSRNLTDRQLRTLGNSGSVVGLNFYSRFLKKDSSLTRIEDLLAHAEHILRVAGEDALALGSDFDGRDTPVEFGSWEGMNVLIEALCRRFSYRVAEKIAYQNALRLWREAGK